MKKTVSSAGVDMGTYEGETPEEALDAMARDAGYKSQADAPETFDGTVTVVSADDAIATEIDHAQLRSVAYNQTVRLDWSEEAADILAGQADDYVDTGVEVEFWGEAESNDPADKHATKPWRIHLVRKVDAEAQS